ncbi:hypothetical protein AGMMS49942_02660 [Spirochaetia bacterium]|nr:hypothetical protein AGMMS49942_02660 [Spirochaetia bacterium]
MIRKAVLLILTFLIITTVIYTQEIEDESHIVYYIRAITFEIIGRTREFALLHILDLKEGQRIVGKATLDALISRKTQDLINERVLKDEECRITYTVGVAGEDGLVPVDLLVHTEDSWNIAVLPQPRWSNDGFRIVMKARDYNFLGTMQPLRVDLGYEYDSKDKVHAVLSAIETDIPFPFLGLLWNFNFDNTFNWIQFRPIASKDSIDSVFNYKNTTGLNLELPWKQTTFTVGFDQFFILNEENSDEEKEETLVDYFDMYMSTELYAKWAVPLGVMVGTFGELTYNASLSENFKYAPWRDIGVGDYRKGFLTTFSHRLEFGEVDWIGNFRRGLNVSLDNSVSFNTYDKDTRRYGGGKEHWSVSVSPTVTGYFHPLHFLGIYGRFSSPHIFNFSKSDVRFWGTDAGALLRGVPPDHKLHADHMLVFNLDFPLGIPRFTPSRWVKKGNKYFKPIDVEFHVSPFVDMALLRGDEEFKDEYKKVNFGDFFATIGIEVFAYSLSWRSLFLRGNIGWDLREWHRTGKIPGPEFFFGMELFF